MATRANAAAADSHGRTTPPVRPWRAKETTPCPSATNGSTMGRKIPWAQAPGDQATNGAFMTRKEAATTAP